MHHDLEIERCIDGERDHGADPEGRRKRRGQNDLVLQDRDRNEGLWCNREPPTEQAPQKRRRCDQAEDRRRHPGIARPAPSEGQQKQHRCCHHQDRTKNVELMRAVMPRQLLERRPAHPEGCKSERQVDPEDQRPVQMLDNEAADNRAADRGKAEHGREIALVTRAFTRRHHVGQDRMNERHQSAAAEPLQPAGKDQHRHRRCDRAGNRPDQEDGDGDQHHGAAAVDVRELAVKRRDSRRGEQIRSDDPREILDIVEDASHGWQRRRHDGLVERRERHREHQPDDDEPDLGMGQPLEPLPSHRAAPIRHAHASRLSWPLSERS